MSQLLYDQIADHRIERVLLGLMLAESGPALAAAPELSATDFALQSHKKLLSVIQAMLGSGEAVNTATVLSSLRQRSWLGDIGGTAYLASLTEDLPRGNSPDPYIARLREKATLRQVVAACELATARIEDGSEASDVIAELGSTLAGAQTSGTALQVRPWSEYVLQAMEEFRAHCAHKGSVLGIASGLHDLDVVTTGFRNGELTYVGAKPGNGKTSFMLQCMYHAVTHGIPAGMISLEMRGTQLIQRLTTLHGKIVSRSIRDPRNMSEQQQTRALEVMGSLTNLPFQVQDVPGMKPGQIATTARKMHQAGARILFVDFVQIIHEDGKDRREAINRVSASLRDTCKSLDIPFVVASQLARRTADPNRRPTLQDLRESGNLEQDAHNVLLLHRPREGKDGDGEFTGEDEVLIEKQREGVTGPVPVRYDGNLMCYVGRGKR